MFPHSAIGGSTLTHDVATSDGSAANKASCFAAVVDFKTQVGELEDVSAEVQPVFVDLLEHPDFRVHKPEPVSTVMATQRTQTPQVRRHPVYRTQSLIVGTQYP